MSKFTNKSTKIRIETNGDTYSLNCNNCETMNYIGGSPYALGSYFYKIMLKTLQSMSENNCKVIKISASWE